MSVEFTKALDGVPMAIVEERWYIYLDCGVIYDNNVHEDDGVEDIPTEIFEFRDKLMNGYGA